MLINFIKINLHSYFPNVAINVAVVIPTINRIVNILKNNFLFLFSPFSILKVYIDAHKLKKFPPNHPIVIENP